MINKRECGVLLPISSLPSKYGIGCFSKSAYDFVDELKAAGQCCWQILPLGPTSYGDSPYQSFSTFAGNPYFISLEDLIQEGVLTEKECNSVDFGNKADDIDYEKLYKGRYKLLRKAYGRSDITKNQDFLKFQREQGYWLKDYALFMAVKDRFEGAPWSEWAQDIRLRSVIGSLPFKCLAFQIIALSVNELDIQCTRLDLIHRCACGVCEPRESGSDEHCRTHKDCECAGNQCSFGRFVLCHCLFTSLLIFQ